MSPSEMHAHLVRLGMEAYDTAFGWAATEAEKAAREKFRVALRERMAQAAQVYACETAVEGLCHELGRSDDGAHNVVVRTTAEDVVKLAKAGALYRRVRVVLAP
jgi:hypothetical protein